MSEIIAFPLPLGPNYTIPDVGDVNWGQAVTSFLTAIPAGVVPTQGTFSLTGDLSFGTSFGLITEYVKSASSNIAGTGFMRLANSQNISWRNNGNTADLPLSVNSMDQLTYNGVAIAGAAGFVTSITGTSHEIIASSSIGAVTLSTPQPIDVTSSVTFGQIIDSGLTASELIVTNGSKQLVSQASPTLTELGYVGGTTSNIQAQLGAITTGFLALSGGTMTGPINMGGNKIVDLTSGTNTGEAVQFAQIAGFRILQTVQTTSTTTFTSSGTSTYQDTNNTATITLSSSSNKVVILATGNLEGANPGTSFISLFKTIGGTPTDLASVSSGFAIGIEATNIPTSLMYLDVPGTTGPITYSVKLKSSNTNCQYGNVAMQVMLLAEIG